MDSKTFLGGSPMGVLIRLLVLSLVVGIILSALGITPQNFFYQINVLLQRIYDLGFGVFQSIVEYLVLGAMVVIPIWFVARLVKTARRPDGQPDSTYTMNNKSGRYSGHPDRGPDQLDNAAGKMSDALGGSQVTPDYKNIPGAPQK